MLTGLKEKPKLESWDEIAKGEFYHINGQHSVSASKKMVEMQLDESILKHFWQWDCYIVWSDNNEKLWSISAYYNRVNHFMAMKPSWSTNILGAKIVWEAMGRPCNPTDPLPVGTSSNARKNAEDKRNRVKFKVC